MSVGRQTRDPVCTSCSASAPPAELLLYPLPAAVPLALLCLIPFLASSLVSTHNSFLQPRCASAHSEGWSEPGNPGWAAVAAACIGHLQSTGAARLRTLPQRLAREQSLPRWQLHCGANTFRIRAGLPLQSVPLRRTEQNTASYGDKGRCLQYREVAFKTQRSHRYTNTSRGSSVATQDCLPHSPTTSRCRHTPAVVHLVQLSLVRRPEVNTSSRKRRSLRAGEAGRQGREWRTRRRQAEARRSCTPSFPPENNRSAASTPAPRVAGLT